MKKKTRTSSSARCASKNPFATRPDPTLKNPQHCRLIVAKRSVRDAGSRSRGRESRRCVARSRPGAGLRLLETTWAFAWEGLPAVVVIAVVVLVVLNAAVLDVTPWGGRLREGEEFRAAGLAVSLASAMAAVPA